MQWKALFSFLPLLALPSLVGASGRTRRVEEKTPTPCLKEYSADIIQAAASKHLENKIGGHEKPHLLLLLGGSGAGKGTFVKHIAKQGFNISEFVSHGLDEYLDYLPEYKQTITDPDAVYKDAADACYGPGAIPIAKAAQDKIIPGRIHTIYEETGKKLDRILKRVLPPFEESGYRITAALIGNDPRIATARAVERFQESGRYAPPDYIMDTFKDNLKNYKDLLQTGRIHEAVYCDNSCISQTSSLEDAGNMQDCLRCWRDDVSASSSESERKFLIPESSLLSGSAQYLQPATQSSDKLEM